MAEQKSITKFTFNGNYAAHFGDKVVTIPDQVFNDQRGFAERDQSFSAILPGGARITVKLDAEAYDLFGSGTGDPIVIREA